MGSCSFCLRNELLDIKKEEAYFPSNQNVVSQSPDLVFLHHMENSAEIIPWHSPKVNKGLR